MNYRPDVRRVPITDLHHRSDLTAAPNWGYQLRRGPVPLTDADLSVILAAMTRTSAH